MKNVSPSVDYRYLDPPLSSTPRPPEPARVEDDASSRVMEAIEAGFSESLQINPTVQMRTTQSDDLAVRSTNEAYLAFYTKIEKEVWLDFSIPMEVQRKNEIVKQRVKEELGKSQTTGVEQIPEEITHILADCTGDEIWEPVITAERLNNRKQAMVAWHAGRLAREAAIQNAQVERAVDDCIRSEKWNKQIEDVSSTLSFGSHLNSLESWSPVKECVLWVRAVRDNRHDFAKQHICEVIDTQEARALMKSKLVNLGYRVVWDRERTSGGWLITLQW